MGRVGELCEDPVGLTFVLTSDKLDLLDGEQALVEDALHLDPGFAELAEGLEVGISRNLGFDLQYAQRLD